MSNVTPCPSCGKDIDAVKAAQEDECPACGTYFGDLLDTEEHDPNDAGPYHEVEA